MSTRAELATWLHAFAGICGLQHPLVKYPRKELRWATRRGIQVFLEGTVDIDGNAVDLRVGLNAAFPTVLPFIQLVSDGLNSRNRAIAHVGADGDLCYTATREMVFDPQAPLDTLSAALEQGLKILQEVLQPKDNHEVLDEFPAMWPFPRSSGDTGVFSFHRPDDQIKVVAAWRDVDTAQRSENDTLIRNNASGARHLNHVLAVADLEDVDAPSRFDPLSRLQFLKFGDTALYIPLHESSSILPPAPGKAWTATDLQRIVMASLDEENRHALREILKRRHRPTDLIILGIPRPGRTGVGRFQLVAVHLFNMGRTHALMSAGAAREAKAQSLRVHRHDRDLVMQRGSSNVELASKRVLQIGCGALGGHLAMALASAGVGHLTLVDHDRFTLDNAFRHVLGRQFNTFLKVDAMRVALLARFPFLTVEPLAHRSQFALPNLNLSEFDLVVDATGDTTHHLFLAPVIRSLPASDRPAFMLSWLEPLGLGGHAVTVMPGRPGCPRCLFTEPAYPMFNVAAFSFPYQNLGRDDLGCGTYHTPFSDLDAVRTAEMAVRTAIRVLLGQESSSRLRSWKGDPSLFLAAGHRLAPRFEKESEQVMAQGIEYADTRCQLCHGAA